MNKGHQVGCAALRGGTPCTCWLPDQSSQAEQWIIWGTQPCDQCGEGTLEHHCRVVCPKCGFTRDCTDP